MNNNRRTMLKALSACTLLTAAKTPLALASGLMAKQTVTPPASAANDWQQAAQIRQSIVVPQFADNLFNITDFGAVNDDKTLCTSAINDAIKACNKAGGGRVLVPQGSFKTGAIHLLSNVELHLHQHATLSFSTDPNDYLPTVLTRWEGMEMMGYSPLIYAYRQSNIAITGKGTLQGNASDEVWWPWKGPHREKHWQLIAGQDQKTARKKLMLDAENAVPVAERHYGDGAYLRPPFIQPYECQQVLIQGITIKNSPFWLVNPVLCNNVTITEVSFLSHGPNSDGCNPESCDHVLIENCIFDTGDDCIAIKSGRNADGRRINIPSQNIVIANNYMHAGHGGVVMGSEISGGVNNVFVENCTMDSPDLERAIRIKTNSIRGGLIEHIRIRNIKVGTVKNAIVINFYYEEGDIGKFDPVVRDIHIENLVCNKVLSKALYLRGFERAPIGAMSLNHCHFNQVAEPSIVENINVLSINDVSINGKQISAKSLLNRTLS
ncbi:glycoside hydrolase family 28 protein [Shewanella sp. A14]